MELRVAHLEEDMADVRATLRRLEPMIVRIDATMPHLATKAELVGELGALRGEMHQEIAGFRSEMLGEIGSVRDDLRNEIGSVRDDLRSEIGSVRDDLRSEIGSLRGELHSEAGSLRSELRSGSVGIRAEISDIKAALAEKPSRAYMWGIVTALIAAYAAGLAALAVLR